MTDFSDDIRTFLLSQNASDRVSKQQKSRHLLFEKKPQQDHSKIKELKEELSAASEIFVPDEWHKNIYHNDTP